MTDRRFDVDGWVRSRDPLTPADRAVAAEKADQAFAEVRRHIATHRRRRSAAAASAAAVALVVCAAAAFATAHPADNPTAVACHRSVSTDARVALVAGDGDPLDVCRAAWADPALDDVFGSQPVPALMACVSEDGRPAVYPARGEDPCSRLGLDRVDGATTEADDVGRLEATISERMAGRCASVPETRRIAREALADLGLDSWKTSSPASSEAGMCGSVGIDAASRTVRVVPIPPPPTD